MRVMTFALCLLLLLGSVAYAEPCYICDDSPEANPALFGPPGQTVWDAATADVNRETVEAIEAQTRVIQEHTREIRRARKMQYYQNVVLRNQRISPRRCSTSFIGGMGNTVCY